MGKFVKGQSGNPSGRPQGTSEVVEYARSYCKWAIDKLREIADDPSEKGSVRERALEAILDRGLGAIPKAVISIGNTEGVVIDQLPTNRLEVEKLLQAEIAKRQE